MQWQTYAESKHRPGAVSKVLKDSVVLSGIWAKLKTIKDKEQLGKE